ncbi:ACP S-malonyltransferase [Sulfoacidibacillus thermotolerans]|uniref:Malonyl CoA-acyl carrier protein transacylase n=1 Tax=Sulfoacidibacillus thermotolerans TaxID=1765684 RepID=A0A2U3D7T4_SULT2|nr:ACP S-malonyltransferase [Sulfoacidibacillus thermotolerans]PWI57350.1 [acyl-carrier-protein] S-malonyltransferase [Sulfoacidibacillus thermotolerans]
MAIAFVFPGQGAQYVGMGKDLLERYALVRETFAEADEALSFGLSKIILDGPESELRLTYYTQPALLTVSIACLRVLQAQVDVQPAVVAGHSLGEYSALVAAGALPFQDAVRIVHARGKFMDEAVPAGLGAMAALLGGDVTQIKELCANISQQHELPVEIANVNCPGQVVASGGKAAVEELIVRAKEAQIKRAILLDVSGPFHSSLMRPATERLTDVLKRQVFTVPRCPVVANVSAKPVQNIVEIETALAQQVASPVLWEASVQTMIKMGVTTFVEVGPGTVLSGLIKKTAKSAQLYHVEDIASLDATREALQDEGGRT